jgi:hypothetical protein
MMNDSNSCLFFFLLVFFLACFVIACFFLKGASPTDRKGATSREIPSSLLGKSPAHALLADVKNKKDKTIGGTKKAGSDAGATLGATKNAGQEKVRLKKANFFVMSVR